MAESKTPDMFAANEQTAKTIESFPFSSPASPQNSAHTYEPETHDTCEISAIYMQRPAHAMNISLGRWFMLAHKLQDSELLNAVSALEAKRVIVRKGYNRLSLQPLLNYNHGDF
jgi:hypothetical protein